MGTVLIASISIVALGIYLVIQILSQKKKSRVLIDVVSKDELTGILNRQFGLQYLKEAIERNKEGEALTICYIDINNLKYVNDNFGHDVGDLLICHIVNHLKKVMNPEFKIIRMGGDEFLTVFPNLSETTVRTIIEAVQQTMNKDKPELLNQITASFSYGIAQPDLQLENSVLEAMLQTADHKMYEYKRKFKEST